jgi:hypothetical protein
MNPMPETQCRRQRLLISLIKSDATLLSPNHWTRRLRSPIRHRLSQVHRQVSQDLSRYCTTHVMPACRICKPGISKSLTSVRRNMPFCICGKSITIADKNPEILNARRCG